MPALESKLRSQLDDVCQKARELAVAYARSALQKRAVDAAEPLSHFGPKDKELRNRLRARGRQVGDVRNADGTQSIDQLAQELAYEFWHRMLFARFLAENNLLMHPDGVAVSLEECEELAPTADPPAANGFVLAARYASTMLPQIFRTDDVLLEIEFAPEQRLALEKLLSSLPKQTFEADDSLGWVYQFWQTAEKKRVNDSSDKIDGRTLPAVTQLFTEHYMVEFLLHNTIGAWWCAKEGIQGPAGGAGIPAGKLPVEMPYLRWRDDGTPAAGKFEGWPKKLAEFTMLDPCCGSGHFLGAAFSLLVPLRMHEENLSAEKACESVLRDNIFGLELDPRCTQIAAFALALAAWKYPGAGGHRPLPPLNIACSGQGVTGKKEEWLALANEDTALRDDIERLYEMFRDAPHLGSLIDPILRGGTLFAGIYSELQPRIARMLAKGSIDADLAAAGVAAQGIAKAAELLTRRYTLVATNVPYKGSGEISDIVSDYLTSHYLAGSPDLATSFMLRCVELCNQNGSVALVTKQEPLFLITYKALRFDLLKRCEWNLVARLGPRAFETITGERVNVALIVQTARKPTEDTTMAGWDVSDAKTPTDKSKELSQRKLAIVRQSEQVRNPDSKIILGSLADVVLLTQYAGSFQGLKTGDDERYRRCHWEILDHHRWHKYQSSVDETCLYGGQECVIDWQHDGKEMARLQGVSAWKKQGVCIKQMSSLTASLYDGSIFDSNISAIIPKNPNHLLPIWTYCSSPEYTTAVRVVDQKVNVSNAALLQVPFELDVWESAASEKYPNGLPEPQSNDPTQWIFEGSIAGGTAPLQVAVARLLGFRWPNQPKTNDAIDKLADSDGILCLPGVRGEAAASELLLEVLHAAYGNKWSDSLLHKLLTEAGCKAGATLEDWLRNQFFEQHCKLFQNRPFIWHIWDGRKDGFSALVNYHKLDYKALENLTYSYLGDWITAQSKSDKAGADSRLGSAQELQSKLKLILVGEPPYDIFVRWKPLHEQAMGWNPNVNDGVRQNIRPFLLAGVLKKEPKALLKDNDRGKEPECDKDNYPWFWSGKEFIGERVNDKHYSNAEKQAARDRKKGAK